MNKEETDLIIAEQNKSTEEILKAVAKVKADYHELCKLKDMRIAELEHQLTHRNCLDCSNHSSKLRMRTLELEKENAELKERISTLEQIKKETTDYTIKVEEERTFVKDQLTKAKELLKQWLQTSKASGCDNFNIVSDTEQFLSEVEKCGQ